MHAFIVNDVEYEYTRGRYYKNIKVMSQGSSFGEIALLQECKRTATIKATHDTVLELATLKKEKFLKYLKMIELLHEDRKIEFFRNLHSFQDLKRRDFLKFINVIEKIKFTRT